MKDAFDINTAVQQKLVDVFLGSFQPMPWTIKQYRGREFFNVTRQMFPKLLDAIVLHPDFSGDTLKPCYLIRLETADYIDDEGTPHYKPNEEGMYIQQGFYRTDAFVSGLNLQGLYYYLLLTRIMQLPSEENKVQYFSTAIRTQEECNKGLSDEDFRLSSFELFNEWFVKNYVEK